MRRDKIIAEFQKSVNGLKVYRNSFTTKIGIHYFMAKEGASRKLVVVAPKGGKILFSGKRGPDIGRRLRTAICPCNHKNALVLRRLFPFTAPSPLGYASAFNAGDRTGLATPGHVRALTRTKLLPVLAAQSMREMTRCRRAPTDLLDDVSWSLFQTKFKRPFACDADHIKLEKDVRIFSDAGATMFTCDPGDFVNSEVTAMKPARIQSLFSKLKDALLLENSYVGKTFTIDIPKVGKPLVIKPTKPMLHTTAVKYYNAVLRAARLYRYAKKIKKGERFDFEVSVDETDSPTTPFDHVFIARELTRLGVTFHSLALRFVGSFEKAIDYKGSLKRFEREFRIHAAIMRRFGRYKLGIHSGSDKFKIYPIIGRYAHDRLHLKTSGTSWLEAVRVIALKNPPLFRKIYKIAYDGFKMHKASYHISAARSSMPTPARLKEKAMPRLLDRSDTRQLIHIAYGSILSDENLKLQFIETLMENEELHYKTVAKHIERHIRKLGIR